MANGGRGLPDRDVQELLRILHNDAARPSYRNLGQYKKYQKELASLRPKGRFLVTECDAGTADWAYPTVQSVHLRDRSLASLLDEQLPLL
jgi:hypothetical protein